MAIIVRHITSQSNIVTDESDCSPSLDACRYACGWLQPNYPVPAIDYYNSPDPSHLPIGNAMEWGYPLDVQLKFRT